MMQTITPYVLYEDVDGAIAFLERAFGFREEMRLTGAEGYVNHAEVRLNSEAVMLGDPGDHYRSPKRLGERTALVYVEVDDVDAHYQRARAAGAEIIEEPADQDYGARRYGAADPEGHHWYFAQPLADGDAR